VEFVVNEDNLPVQALLSDNVTFQFGLDKVDAPSKVTVLGANQEGFLNSRLLSPIDGLEDPAGVTYSFLPAWPHISISFYDYFGVYRTYIPTERELQYALMSIDHWAYYKKLQVSEFGDPADEGYTAAQHWTFQSRMDPGMPVSEFYNNSVSGIRIIQNRYEDDHIWTLEWYSRIANHANNHYGKTYALEGFVFNEDEGAFQLLDAAWCNLENQIDGTYFTENYGIRPLFAPVSPFVTQDFKVQAHAVMPSSTIYGPEGISAPAPFTDWNEDAHPSGGQTFEHYIPVDLKRVGQRVVDPRGEENAFEDYPEGTIIAQFPVLVASGKSQDAFLTDLVTLYELGIAAANSGTNDIPDPTMVVHPWQSISGVAIPVQSRKRYGQTYPALWASGTGSGTRVSVVVDDRFAPWNYFPRDSTNSVDIMSQRVSGFIQAELVSVDESRFAQFDKIDWPFIGFDAFATQSFVSGVWGRRDHGVTDITVSYSDGIPRTTYGIKSFFTDFVKDAPLGQKNFADLNNIIHPVNFMELSNNPQRPTPDLRRIGDGSKFPFTFPPVGIRKEVYAVTITQVFNRGDTTKAETYFSITKDNVPKPGGAADPLDPNDLVCRDGFLNVGDKCLYHVEYNAQNRRRRYYSGGTDLTAGAAVVEVTDIDSGANTVDISYRGFSIPGVSVITGADVTSIATGDLGSLQTDGTAHADNNPNITGLRPEVEAPAGTYFIPVEAADSAAATPVIINTLTAFGTSGALAAVQPIVETLGAGYQYVGSGASTGNVLVIPHPQFAQSGDIGIFCQNDGSGFVFINRQSFSAFNG
ncbi:MAG: hypothetical protein MN733_37750, partial [Nitrososphaera sp.]|nr:hypothetical protein [Nitrososphaera sp.]